MMKEQTAKDHPENSTISETNSAIISFGTALTFTLVCGGLLLITVLFYRKQKVRDQCCFHEKYQNNAQINVSQTACTEKEENTFFFHLQHEKDTSR